jgi:hypothetical protein
MFFLSFHHQMGLQPPWNVRKQLLNS